MKHGYFLLALSLVPLVVVLAVLAWRKRQEGKVKAANEAWAAEWLVKQQARADDAPVHRPRFSEPPPIFQLPQVPARSWVDIQLEPDRGPEFLAHMPYELPTLRFVGAGPWECVPGGSDNTTPASSDTCASSSSDSSSTSGTD